MSRASGIIFLMEIAKVDLPLAGTPKIRIRNPFYYDYSFIFLLYITQYQLKKKSHMTSLISFLKQSKKTKKSEIKNKQNLGKIQNILNYLGLQNQVTQKGVLFYLSSNFLKQNKVDKHKSVAHCQFIGQFEENDHFFIVTFRVFDKLGQQIRAKSQYHRTMLIRYLVQINAQLQLYSFNFNPLTGKMNLQLRLCNQPFGTMYKKVLQIIEHFLKEGVIVFEIVLQILQHFSDKEKLPLIQEIADKLQLLKVFLKPGSDEDSLNLPPKPTPTQILHQKHFGQPISNPPKAICDLEFLQMKKLKPRYIEELNRVILQTKKGATSNYVHKRGHIMNEKYEDKSKLITTFYTQVNQGNKTVTQQESVVLLIDTKQRVAEKKKILKKLSLTNYFSFLETYVDHENNKLGVYNEEDEIDILIQLHNNGILLKDFMDKNSKVLSLNTRISIIIEMLAICQIVTKKITILKFNPPFNIKNFHINSGMKLKLQEILGPNNFQLTQHKREHYFRQIFLSVFNIIFKKHIKMQTLNKPYYQMQKSPTIMTIDDGQAKYYAPTPVSEIIKIFCLQNYEKSQYSVPIEDALYVFVTLSDVMRKFLPKEIMKFTEAGTCEILNQEIYL